MSLSSKMFAAALVLGAATLGGPPAVAVGDVLPGEVQQVSTLQVSVVHADEFTVVLQVIASPDFEGEPATIQFGEAPGMGPILAQVPLHAGLNLIPVPAMPEHGWYTVTAKGVQTEDDVEFLY